MPSAYDTEPHNFSPFWLRNDAATCTDMVLSSNLIFDFVVKNSGEYDGSFTQLPVPDPIVVADWLNNSLSAFSFFFLRQPLAATIVASTNTQKTVFGKLFNERFFFNFPVNKFT
jgi:hypothetical protein